MLTRSRSSTDASQSVLSSPAHQRKPTDPQSPEGADLPPKKTKPPFSRSHSHSPSGSDVRVLGPDLTCIGLADGDADMWGLKIVKLVAYPDLITPPAGGSSFTEEQKPSFDSVVLSPVADLGISVSLSADVSCMSEETEVPGSQSESESDTIGSKSDDTTHVGDLSDDEGRASSESPIYDPNERHLWDEDEEDVADESSEDDDPLSSSPPSIVDSVDDPSVAKASEHQKPSSRPKLPHVETDKTAKPRIRAKRRGTRQSTSPFPPPPLPPLVPFFSFTRTPEGSSLTASVPLLAALFPPSERHMVICSGELDLQDSRAGSPHGDEPTDDANEDEDSFVLPETQGTLKCLQIDLRKFGLGTCYATGRYLPLLTSAS